jgi:uncharacterized protein YbcI
LSRSGLLTTARVSCGQSNALFLFLDSTISRNKKVSEVRVDDCGQGSHSVTVMTFNDTAAVRLWNKGQKSESILADDQKRGG